MSAWTGILGTRYTSRRPRGLAEWKPGERLGGVLDDVISQLDAERAYWPLTARHEGYRLIGHAGYDKTDETFDDAEAVILRGRRAGFIPWEAILDGRSDTEQLPTWATVDEFAADAPDFFHRDLLTGQRQALEVWVEAAGMVPQVSAVADDYTIKVMTSSGFRTTSAIYALADRVIRRIKDSKQGTAVLLVGDLDADGISAMDSTADDAWAFLTDMTDLDRDMAERMLRFDIVALTPEQVRAYGLTTKPNGSGVRRGDYDGPAVQLEALDAADFAAILRTEIESYLDMEQVERQRELRDQGRAEIRRRLER